MRPTDAALAQASELAARFDPFRDPYLADPYLFFAEARAASPVFYSPKLDYWIVTRYADVRHVFQTPKLFSAANALSPIKPVCPAAQNILAEGRFSADPVLTNSDPPATPGFGASRTSRLRRAGSRRWSHSSANSRPVSLASVSSTAAPT